jgi:tRNA pseudouridine13 synthase
MKYHDTELHWPTTGTPPIAQAQLRTQPEDFVVEETNTIELSGAGEHLWLQLRKRGVNTEFAARQLARTIGVPPRAVSYAGMKDRHALTTQWFSVHLPGRDDPDLAGKLPPEMELLAAQRHARKLQRGALKGNRFEILLRACQGERAALQQRVDDIARGGVPNYFGEQRFGRAGDNLARAAAMFGGSAVRDRHLRGIYLSAARSLLFNEVLARRVEAGSWAEVLEGEVCVLNGSNSFFVPASIDSEIERRLREGDIHPSGPLWGAGDPPSAASVNALERAVAQRFAALAEGLAEARLAQERRALRVIPGELSVQWLDAESLRLRFALPAGTYATAVLREIASYRDIGAAGGLPDAG